MANYEREELESIRKKSEASKNAPQINVYKTFDKVFPKAIELIFNNKMDANTLRLGHDNIRVNNSFYLKKKNDTGELEKSKAFILFLIKQKMYKLLEDKKLIKGLVNAMDMCSFWIRDFKEWEKESHNVYKQFSSLVRHLFCRYDVPEFLDSAWYDSNTFNSSRYIDWFLHIGSGESLKDIKTFPFEMNRKMGHHFLNAPVGFGVEDALRYSQVLGLNGDWRLSQCINSTRLGFHKDGFDTSVVKFFAETPMLNHDQVGPIIDYIMHLKGNQGNKFTMKGRTIHSLISGMENWHVELNRIRRVEEHERRRQGLFGWMRPAQFEHFKWERNSIKGFSYSEKIRTGKNNYEITEILSSVELQEEGRAMSHCVFSYASQCKSGNCSIWSLKLNKEREVTIEIRKHQIVQVRGKRNSRPSEKIKSIISRWASASGLTISNYSW